MSDTQEQHNVILSHNKVHHNVVKITLVPVMIFTVVLVWSVWPYLPYIGFIVACCFCIIAIAGVLWACYALLHDHRHRQLQSRVIAHNDVVVVFSDAGELLHLSALHEQAKLPQLQLQAPQEKGPTADEWRVLHLRSQGLKLEDIATVTGWKYNKVQKVCADWKKHVSECVDGKRGDDWK